MNGLCGISGKKWKAGSFPLYLQHNEVDCGPACLYMVANSYGFRQTFQSLRRNFSLTGRGVSLQNLSEVAESIGFHTMCVRTSFSKLCDKVELPCILVWNCKHLVVVYRIDRKRSKIYLADPGSGFLSLSEDEFKKNWVCSEGDKGIVMLLEPVLGER